MGAEPRKPGQMKGLDAKALPIRCHIAAPAKTIEKFMTRHAAPLNPVTAVRPKMSGTNNDVEDTTCRRGRNVRTRHQELRSAGNPRAHRVGQHDLDPVKLFVLGE
jgi:hypothetical protein